jgi:hypothetical protein
MTRASILPTMSSMEAWTAVVAAAGLLLLVVKALALAARARKVIAVFMIIINE